MKVDCTHPRADHSHGTALAFAKDGCRCTPCKVAYRRAKKMEAYRTATGTHSYVDATRAREHVAMLLESLTVAQVEARSGVDRTAIRVLVGTFPGRPASRRITRRTEAALLAVDPVRVADNDHGLVDATGTIRRLQALCALGWPRATLNTELGCSTRTTWVLATQPGPHLVTVRVRDAVRDVYDRYSMLTPPPCRQVTFVRNLAAARGWAPPLAWDDDSIDDPTAQPEAGARARGVDLDDYLFLLRTGETVDTAAERLGVTFAAVDRAARRARRDDVLHAIARTRGLTREAVPA